ncbi:hypothetical protein NM688_g6333 [Phlebia brevispora]|uniref:Uncharacterized protein n=1 Tax=Phlebia brevispora TaxID=194682 RepID=A0ACC1SH82_9APHY|nr:hypothetical protein NM688_g6333 [Phlebia brevispora]
MRALLEPYCARPLSAVDLVSGAPPASQCHRAYTRTLNTDEITSYLQGEDRDFNIDPVLSALNLVLRTQALRRGAVPVGQNKYFFLTTERARLSAGLEARRGYFMSVRPTFDTLMVNVNTSFAAFYDRSMSGPLDEVLTRHHPNDLRQLLPGLKVFTTHLGYKRAYKVFALGTQTAAQAQFKWNKTGRNISVKDFFKQGSAEYGITLRRPDLPVINVGSRQRAQDIPPELCTVPENQTFKSRLNTEATRSMINIACNPPATNANFITGEGLPLLQLSENPPSNSALESFGLSVSQQMAVVPARILDPPRLQYSTGRPAVRDGGWNIMGGTKFRRGGDMRNWAVLVVREERTEEFLGRNEANLNSFVQAFKDKCKLSGMIVAETLPPIEKTPVLPYDRREAVNIIRNKLEAIGRNKPSFVLVLLYREDDYIYPGIKNLCDRVLGLQTVCMLLKKATKGRVDQYFANVALKVNTKLRGVNHVLEENTNPWLKNTMLVGIDVTHPSPGSMKGAPSIAGVVANTDSDFANFPVSFRLQVNRNINKDAQEMVEGLTEMMVERLQAYKEANPSTPPGKVIIYRDGVSEGQYKLLLQDELPKILEAFRRMKVKPKLSIIVCGKRHHARFPGTSKDNTVANGNTTPGTVVDQGVTDIYNHDFYLQVSASRPQEQNIV